MIGLPSIFLTMLWCNRATLDTERTRAWLGFLYVKYRREKWFGRRSSCCTSSSHVDGRARPPRVDPPDRRGDVVTFIWLVLLAINKPYRNQSDTYVALGMYVAQHVALWGGLLKRVQVADEFGGTEVFNGILFTMVFPISLVAVLLVVQVSNKVGDKLRERSAAKAAAAEDAKAEADEAAAKALGGGGGARTAPAEVQRGSRRRRGTGATGVAAAAEERMAVQRLASSFCADGGAARGRRCGCEVE